MSFGDVAHRHAFLGDGVVPRVRLGLLDRQPVEAGDVEDMRRRPAVASVADIGAQALLAIDRDRRGDQPLLHRVVDLRQADHRHVDPVRGDRCGRLFRGRARDACRRRWSRCPPSPARPGAVLAMAVPEVTTSGRSEPARAEPSASITRAVVLAVRHEAREVVVEGEVDDAVRSGGALLKAGQVLERSAMDLGAGGGQRRRLVVGAAEADHLMAGGDQFGDHGRADECRSRR